MSVGQMFFHQKSSCPTQHQLPLSKNSMLPIFFFSLSTKVGKMAKYMSVNGQANQKRARENLSKMFKTAGVSTVVELSAQNPKIKSSNLAKREKS
jgi:hypothetical protein